MLLRTVEIQNLFKDYSDSKKIKKQPRFWYNLEWWYIVALFFCDNLKYKCQII